MRKLSVNLLGLDALMIGRFKGKIPPVSENQELVAIFQGTWSSQSSSNGGGYTVPCSYHIWKCSDTASRISVAFFCLLAILSDHEEKCVE